MLRERIGHSTSSQVVRASPGLTVFDVCRLMLQHQTGAVLIVEGDRLVGIFTERDAVYRVLARGLDPRALAVAEVMTAQPVTIDPQARRCC